jgi:hypothetical protein
MTLPLKPESVALLWEYLRSLPPFSGIKMPHADDVEIWVTNDKRRFAQWMHTGEHHRVSISSATIGSTMILAMYLGHETCHAAVHELGLNTGGNENTHNAAFLKLAAWLRSEGVLLGVCPSNNLSRHRRLLTPEPAFCRIWCVQEWSCRSVRIRGWGTGRV